jgi:hypothetical protein
VTASPRAESQSPLPAATWLAATWYDWDDGRILVNMDFERLRLTHMRRDPRVAVAVLDIDN